MFTSASVSIDQPTAILNNFEPAIPRRSAHEIYSEVINTADRRSEDSLMEVVSPAFVKNHTVKINGLVGASVLGGPVDPRQAEKATGCFPTDVPSTETLEYYKLLQEKKTRY